MKTIRSIYIIAAAVLCLSACDGYLDVMPDNRTEIDTREKVQALLTSAYPTNDYMLVTEMLSDNVDDYGEENPNYDRFIRQVYNWEDVTESDNESPERIWGSAYSSIAAANQVLQAIEEMGGAEAAGLLAEKAEALICRAYCHFILVNIFALNYNEATSGTDPGVTYMEGTETSLNPKYGRETVAEVYEKIERDLTEALKHISDEYYTVPKYHFNQKAAYAFAAKFYLYYEKWEESVRYADLCLGSRPETMLRDWSVQAAMTQDHDVICNHFIDHNVNANLLLLTAYSKMGKVFGPYNTYSRYAHGNYLAENEDGIALATMMGSTNKEFYYMAMKVYSGSNLDKVIFWKLPYLFEYTDPVAKKGYNRTVYPAFTADEVLLERAEAKAMLKKYDEAVADVSTWLSCISRIPSSLTPESIMTMMADIPYCKWDHSTVRKHLKPSFTIGAEGSVQESILQYILLVKRIDTLGQGLRWFDIKRYGIEVERRVLDLEGLPLRLTDRLTATDLRRAVQIPQKVVDAGYEPNRR